MDAHSDLARLLDDAGHDTARPSLFICEGLFAYLTLEVVASLCQTLRARGPEGSVLVSTYLVVPEEGRRGQTLRVAADQLLRAIGEVRRSEYYPGDAEKLMVVTGWRVARTLPSPPGWLAQGSHRLALASEPA
jgi:O-methyltransferase involved in polyketide biosynthesis